MIPISNTIKKWYFGAIFAMQLIVIKMHNADLVGIFVFQSKSHRGFPDPDPPAMAMIFGIMI